MARLLRLVLPVFVSALVLGGCDAATKTPSRASSGARGAGAAAILGHGTPQQGRPEVRTTYRRQEAGAAEESDAKKRVYRYYYLPQTATYYAPDRKRYYWLSERGWKSGPQPPRSYKADAGQWVELELDSAVPYVHHAVVEASHPSGR